MARFATVSLVREAPDVLLRFARHYLAAGADQVMLFWDGDDPPVLPALPGLVPETCDAAFWERLAVGQGIALFAAFYGLTRAQAAAPRALGCGFHRENA